MKLLLDTQAFLWFLLDDERLSISAKAAIEKTEILYLSPASHWGNRHQDRAGEICPAGTLYAIHGA